MGTKHWIALLIAIIIVIFSLQNAEVTSVRFLIWKVDASRILIILGSFVLGVLVGVIFLKRKKNIK
ncbi:MAG: DUF1049 domain-containing protein [Muricauda sp.]|uniref:Lipopolysaccharide assembly protein A domain-containing protein n=1 Tax=Flagellimonas lutaonensis TaxID=516051 RepID=A0A0D5YTW7_9FLAO|nr:MULTISPECIES: LapA family protein [Allomuricauda]AKA35339.1 hypothetical protein VC82_1728 [Allomuricauda lutaonensis]MBC31807.1 DUF1049 domain-containing protein [Allomuricauda sp.]|tara:strand:- start:849 stop:1046 length:198 start_codon:yes stop_codon:yes gene_type:complete